MATGRKLSLIERRPFSLIELLVVIAIIGILMAMLMPALVKAKNKARILVCASNMRQCAIAYHSYAGDANQKLPDGLRNRDTATLGVRTGILLAMSQETFWTLETYGFSRVAHCSNLPNLPRFDPFYNSYYLGYAVLAGHRLPAVSTWQSPLSVADDNSLGMFTDRSFRNVGSNPTQYIHDLAGSLPPGSDPRLLMSGQNVTRLDGSTRWVRAAALTEHNGYYWLDEVAPYVSTWTVDMYSFFF